MTGLAGAALLGSPHGHDRLRRVASRSALLAYDADLDRVARIVGVDVDEASLRA
jgi:hypothetical protein